MINASNSQMKAIIATEQAVTVTGTGAAEQVTGNLLANHMKGGKGADTLEGLAGNDTYQVDNPGDVIIEQQKAGIDTVITTVSYTLPEWVEHLKLKGTAAMAGQGNGLDNTLTGTAGDNWLDGGDGIDTVSYRGARGAVTVNLALSTPQNTGGAGNDTLLNFERVIGSSFSDTLTGNQGRNTLIGGQGADTLDGAGGRDQLVGGAEADYFVLSDPDGTAILSDFTPGVDRIVINQSALPVGNGDNVIDQMAVVEGLAGFSPEAEYVRFDSRMAADLEAHTATALIRAADRPFALGHTALFTVSNQTQTGIFHFEASDVDNRVATHELKLIGLVTGTTLELSDLSLI
jgi:Ca2+-binding RTX toxin-like protein